MASLPCLGLVPGTTPSPCGRSRRRSRPTWEEGVASREGCRVLQSRLLSLCPLPAPTAEPEALGKKQRLVLDKAYRHLLDQGFGVLELASLDFDEVPAMARQLAEELAIPMIDWLEEALCWLATRSAAGS